MQFIDFFAGIGGFRRGLELAGHECIGFCEYDRYAVASYTSMHLITKEQARYLKTLELKQRQKEILKPEYRNGEWYAKDISEVKGSEIPKADIWTGGFPCQDISVAGHQKGFKGERSSLFFQFVRLLKEQEEENKPEWIILENVKNLLSVNGGWDFTRVLYSLGKVGYNVGWQVFNSKDHGVPQNRERVYIVGHLRGRGRRKIFPFKGAGGENSIQIKVIGSTHPHRHSTGDIHGLDGIMSTCTRRDYKQPKQIAIPVLTPDRPTKRQNVRRFKENGDPAFTLTAQDRHGVAISVKVRQATKAGYDIAAEGDSINFSMPNSKTRRGRVGKQVAQTLDTQCNQGIIVALDEKTTVYATWYEKYKCYIAIRKLTPKECFRLQGWKDKYFNRAKFVNSDSQLYKQAGNGVTVNVVKVIGEALNGNNRPDKE